ncbi:MAG: hypothetical protein H0Z24_05850 [Thermosipho sp. (in: Bacteria)]|nr:hypothetical protein [Thermosipho sp. (in: thermotogales)]
MKDVLIFIAGLIFAFAINSLVLLIFSLPLTFLYNLVANNFGWINLSYLKVFIILWILTLLNMLFRPSSN